MPDLRRFAPAGGADGFEFTCWNGEIPRGAFVLDDHDREAPFLVLAHGGPSPVLA